MSQQPVRRPTLDTVATAVGVSRATVSNAYNRPDQLSAALRERIISTASELGYAGPDPVARSLATRQSGAVVVMLGGGLSAAFTDPALSIVLDSLTSTLDRERALLLLPGTGAGPNPDSVARAQADIAIAYSLPDDSPALAQVSARSLPLVVIDQPALPATARVDIADEAGAAMAARHVRDLGHRRVAILSFALDTDGHRGPVSPDRWRAARFRVTRDRIRGYRGELGQDVPIWEAPCSARDHGREGARWLLTRDPRPTALLCLSDELAMGAIRAATDLGLRVPSDVSIVGFDDTPAAHWADPPLTTVRQDLTEKGRTAAELALSLLDGSRPGPARTLPVTLIERSSTAPV
ncbi:Transcriptional regulator, LacI family [Alloactinosynnema sp. L-07]|uniref:LacI family DNA-binding transcriptional regulator n=1 Tax=Alloactinosynnema sp. L-07 TaxID=1653480 RepID=UPI00065EF7A9|nr:LacI family DNA-binding transcriptional regulator [Alloactinosynnema sp. L-07]CRK55342.1 Transcriptional regulator, LacI family [Alloactinosynnema sp. L-07]